MVQVTKDSCEVLTECDKEFKDISWEMNDEEEPVPKKEKNTAASAVLKTKLRAEEKVCGFDD